jgi:DNA repair exonuclease SbcCD ATPase subunit
MTTPIPVAARGGQTSVSIEVTVNDGTRVERSLSDGDGIVIGSSPACGIRIEGNWIAAMHCTVSFEDGKLMIEDWDTGGGTYVQGQRIGRRAILGPGEGFRIGDFSFSTKLHGAVSALSEGEWAPSEQRTQTGAGSEVTEEESEVTPESEDLTLTADAQSDADDVWDSADDLDESYEETEQALTPLSYAREGLVSDDEMELLRIEVEFLRGEVAQRDAQITDLRRILDASVVGDADLPSREEVESLVGRLEELLAELDHSDERLKTMEELLRVSEEAGVAADEERNQMESWISELERRVRQWEEEWQAERDTLSRKITELTAQRDEAEKHGGSRENTALLLKLREEITGHESQIKTLQSERDELQNRLQAADVGSFEEKVATAVDAAVREERLQLSQAKAEFARERSKLVQKHEELLSQRDDRSTENEADLRIRAFREHLREVKETQSDTRAAPSLSDRLGKLWRKIEGKPLDTD